MLPVINYSGRRVVQHRTGWCPRLPFVTLPLNMPSGERRGHKLLSGAFGLLVFTALL